MALQTTTKTPTGWAPDAAYANYQKAQEIAGRPYTPYTGNMLAGPNANQQAGYAQLANGQNFGQSAMTAATNAAQGAANYQAPQVQAPGYQPALQGVMNTAAVSAGSATPWTVMNTHGEQAALAQMQAAQMNRGDVRDVASKNFTDYDINQYMNPYIGTVVNNALADLSRQNDIVNNGTNARASAAGAFGGSRQAVANTINNENYLRESGNLSGNLRHQGFNAASGLIMQDANRDLTAQQSNQQMDFGVGSLNTNNRQQAGLQNMLQANNMSQYNASNRQQAGMATSAAHNAAAAEQARNANQMAQYNAGNQQQANMATSAAHNAALANQAAALNSAGQFNSDLSLRAQLANQSAGQNAINTNLSAANALNGMGMDQQRWNLTNANAQLTAGTAQQQQEQAQLNEQYRRWAEAQGYDRNQLAYLQGALSGAPMGEATTSPYYNNSAANALAGGIGAVQLAGYLPSAINGVKSAWDAGSSLLDSWGW